MGRGETWISSRTYNWGKFSVDVITNAYSGAVSCELRVDKFCTSLKKPDTHIHTKVGAGQLRLAWCERAKLDLRVKGLIGESGGRNMLVSGILMQNKSGILVEGNGHWRRKGNLGWDTSPLAAGTWNL
ncbi:unnamed protein product [Sphenostylis stenocarpa]|uniref:Uncharacterized protein n=1 Tax=Sphenostylis stenocarpa TaxID=92480 RepID=A0AA86VRP7_9FABA|nr:unnamed protein product [Sphenostylis stenocarpa]